MLTDVYATRKNNVIQMMSLFSTRKEFVSKIDIDYNLFNQYIGPRSKKNIGDKLALRITESFYLPKGWLDHPQDLATIKSILESQQNLEDSLNNNTQKVEVNHTSNSSNNQFRMLKLINILKISKGEDLEVTTDLQEKRAVSVPSNIENPMAYLIKGTGYKKPYSNGYAAVCQYMGQPIAGEDVIVFCKDGKIFAGEFLFEQDILLKIESIDGQIDSILKDNIARTSPVKMFISPSQLSE